MVARVHGARQHLVQVHVCASVQQRTPRPAHARVSGRSLPPSLRGGGRSGAATAPGARSRSRSAGARSSSRVLAGEARRGRAGGRRAPLTSAHLSRAARAQVKLASTRRPRPGADSPARRAAPSTHFLWALPGSDRA